MELNIKSGKPVKGKLLISEPFLPDPSFKRTVILLVEHNEEGTVGFVLNRPLRANLKEVMPDFPDFNSLLYYGGPVQPDTLHYVHRKGELLDESIAIGNDVYWGGNFEELRALADAGLVEEDDFKFFVGYSGWSPGQLDEEMEAKTWLVADCRMEDVFSKAPDQLWRDVLSNMGKDYKILSNFPEDPNLN